MQPLTCVGPDTAQRDGSRLSVVVPVYNEAVSLPLILNRVIGAIPQVEKEIIVVDDCSTDGSGLAAPNDRWRDQKSWLRRRRDSAYRKSGAW